MLRCSDRVLGDNASPADPLREVHLFISGKYVITAHRDPLPPLDEQRDQLDGRMLHSEQFLLHRILDALTDSFFPLLAEMDDQIDERDYCRDVDDHLIRT